jgi:hypothetical protein
MFKLNWHVCEVQLLHRNIADLLVRLGPLDTFAHTLIGFIFHVNLFKSYSAQPSTLAASYNSNQCTALCVPLLDYLLYSAIA